MKKIINIRVLVTLIMISALVYTIQLLDLKLIAEHIFKVKLRIVVLFFCLISIMNVLRAYRFKTAITDMKEIGIYSIWKVVNIHQFCNYVLPARSGELSFIYLSSKYLNQKNSEATGALILVRFLDLLMLLIFSILSIEALSTATIPISRYVIYISCAVVIGSAVLIIILITSTKIKDALRLKNKFLVLKVEKLIRYIDELSAFFQSIGKSKKLIIVFLATFSQYILLFTIFWITNYIIGYDLRISQVIVGGVFTILGNILPVNAIGSIGTLEAGWVLGFGIVGVDISSAMASAIIFHVLFIVIGALLAGLSYINLKGISDIIKR